MSYISKSYAWIIGVFGGLLMFFTNSTPKSFQVLVVMMTLDILTGIFKGIINKNLRSVLMTVGLAKKGVIFLTIIFTVTLDSLIFPGEMFFSGMAAMLAIGTESLSIIENIEACGVPIPKAVRDRVHSMADSNNKNYNEELADKIDNIGLSEEEVK